MSARARTGANVSAEATVGCSLGVAEPKALLFGAPYTRGHIAFTQAASWHGQSSMIGAARSFEPCACRRISDSRFGAKA